jgi:lysozyme family protein
MNNALLQQLKPSYANLWGKMIINPARIKETAITAALIMKNKDEYIKVQLATGIPWQFIGILHCLECECSFKLHLHNGDPLTAKTVQKPAGRPLTGTAPFTWKDSAIDALTMRHLSAANDFSTEVMLYQFEAYNGFGYRNNHSINSPYLWAGSNQYTKGKYGSDGHYNPELVSKQIGAALLLKVLSTK